MAAFTSRAAGGDFTASNESPSIFSSLVDGRNNDTFGVDRVSFGRISLAHPTPASDLTGSGLAGYNNRRFRERSAIPVPEISALLCGSKNSVGWVRSPLMKLWFVLPKWKRVTLVTSFVEERLVKSGLIRLALRLLLKTRKIVVFGRIQSRISALKKTGCISQLLLFEEGKTVYLSPSLELTDITEDITSLLLSIERSVTVLSSLLPRLPSLPVVEVNFLVATLDLVAEIKYDNFTPQKVKSNVSYMVDLQEDSFYKTPLVHDNLSPSKPDIFVPILCTRLDALTLVIEQLRQDFVDWNQNSTNDFHSLVVKVELLRDHLGIDCGITSVPLRSAWEEIFLSRIR